MMSKAKKIMVSLCCAAAIFSAVGYTGKAQAADFFAPLPATTPAPTDTAGHPDNVYKSAR